jgi:hypothetical protein
VATVATVSLLREDRVLGLGLVFNWVHDEVLARCGPGTYWLCGPDGGNWF